MISINGIRSEQDVCHLFQYMFRFSKVNSSPQHITISQSDPVASERSVRSRFSASRRVISTVQRVKKCTGSRGPRTYVERVGCDIYCTYCLHSFPLTTVDGAEMLVKKLTYTPKRDHLGAALALSSFDP